ncbi:hypothetical protein [Myroides odoratus]|nr:hypothetical protein [Myroides odoratus]QQU04213.1 hypothetical protein I6I89_02705 [Myroides odoratus]
MKTETILSLFALGVSITTLIVTYIQNRRSRISQIQTAKLEELLECIYELSKFYKTFKQLESEVERVKTGGYDRQEYFKTYYHEFLQKRMDKIDRLLSRIEVLYKAYTDKYTRNEVEKYFKMMECFYMYVLNTGDLYKTKYYPNGFPTYEEFNTIITSIERDILMDINKYK